MVKGQARLWLRQHILVQVFTFEFWPQVVRQTVRHEITSIRTIRAEAMDFSEGVVKRRIKGARGDQHAQFWNRLFELQAMRNFSCCFQVLRFESRVDVDRVASLLEVCCDISNA